MCFVVFVICGVRSRVTGLLADVVGVEVVGERQEFIDYPLERWPFIIVDALTLATLNFGRWEKSHQALHNHNHSPANRPPLPRYLVRARNALIRYKIEDALNFYDSTFKLPVESRIHIISFISFSHCD